MSTVRTFIANKLIDWGNKLLPTTDTALQVTERAENLKRFWFLADAPQFIDRPLVDQLFDAIFQPAFELASRSSAALDSKAKALSAEMSGGGEFSVPTMFKINATAKVADSDTRTTSTTNTDTWNAVQSSERRLEKLVNLYIYSYPERCFRVPTDLSNLVDQTGASHSWSDVETSLSKQGGVRPLIMFDLESKTKLLPTFAELDTADVVSLHEQFLDLVNRRADFPIYPSYGCEGYAQKSCEYWRAFEKIFDSTAAMRVVEQAGKNSARIEWIDFRLLCADGPNIIAKHLHISPRGEYPSGTFAYRLVRRAEHHGTRILGTLKSGNDVNVLAIYER